MGGTGYNWDASWTILDAAITLMQGGTTEDTSAVVNCDGKAACEVSIDADYSNHAKATGGLFVYILRDVNGTSYETEDDNPWGFEMPFTQNDTNRRTFSVDVSQVSKFKVMLDWDNSTGSSSVVVATAYKFATIPAAS